MTQLVDVTCPTCGFTWQEDLDWHREQESIHTLPRSGWSPGEYEQFRFRCPQDGTWVSVAASPQ